MIGFMALPDDSDDNRKPNLVPDYIEMTTTTSTATTTSMTTTTTTTTTNKSRRTLGCERMSGEWLSIAEMDGTSLLSEEGYIQSSARVLYCIRVTEEKRLPWQVKLLGPEGCGGTLIANDIVITAAHCMVDKYGSEYRPNRWTIMLGSMKRYAHFDDKGFDQEKQRRFVDKIIVHEHYNDYTNDNDIAILRLSRPVEFSNQIQPACIA